jgi:heptosyltransferase-2
MKSIIVRAPNWIGDQILAYPFFHFLRRAYPRARITSVCVGWTESLQFRNLIDDVIVIEKPLIPGIKGKYAALEASKLEIQKKAAKHGAFEMGIILPNSFSSAFLFWKAGVKNRIGYAGDGRSLFLNEALPFKPELIGHRSEAYVGLLPELARPPTQFRTTEFWGVPPEAGKEDLDPGVPSLVQFHPQKAWPEGTKEAETLRFPVDLNSPYWVLAPGSTAESRRWPIENFANLAKQVVRATGLPGVIVGGISEVMIGEKLSQDRELKLKDFTGKGSVASLWPLFRNAKFMVSNDSGLAHVASLCGTKVQIVWGAGDPKRTEPLGPGRVRVLFNPVDCWPCEKNSCSQAPTAKLACIRGIQSEEVWEEMKRGLGIS